MSRVHVCGFALGMGLLALGCGDDGTSTGAGGAGGSSTATGGASGVGGSSSTGGDVACGTELTCMGGEVCVEEVFAPTNCEPLMAPDVACPANKLETFCGGAGGTCCCDAPAPSTFACDAGSGCGGAVTCACLTCPMGKQCQAVGSETSGMFRCEEPPMP